MLSYQHAWHAGNFADVHKHLAQFALIERLMQKGSALSLVDTHAGRGHYPLSAPETAKLGEYRDGVLPLWQARAQQAGLLGRWCDALATLQDDPDTLSRYPGSPWWFARAMRANDRLTLYELHPGEHRHLEDATLETPHIRRLKRDGLSGLVHQLPVRTPRLCVLIDPSYEVKDEYGMVASTLSQVVRQMRHAIVLIWYPLLGDARHQRLLDGIREHGVAKVWRSELTHHDPAGERGLYGSGLLLLNPPWQLDTQLDEAFSALAALYGDQASHTSDWWMSEQP
ncbi:ribosomal RNA large subunit methyltransferase J [Kushneria pakistanensis]|uniref:Ribosomal RNA large subunit methyltransferase J n=1 Tax=Kushneria pakistanensis TaxID=1508770 RepID=A0ABQ3FFJ2_9GAMM|nr:23S rRNA (adenine(2030)-N(6))-methyltransferase RlmJ [Kushneria pakistanensis]GHC22333.1 ribosomal RNA large subunit methyltransferase J [Kushneria pakistanensis]